MLEFEHVFIFICFSRLPRSSTDTRVEGRCSPIPPSGPDHISGVVGLGVDLRAYVAQACARVRAIVAKDHNICPASVGPIDIGGHA